MQGSVNKNKQTCKLNNSWWYMFMLCYVVELMKDNETSCIIQWPVSYTHLVVSAKLRKTCSNIWPPQRYSVNSRKDKQRPLNEAEVTKESTGIWKQHTDNEEYNKWTH